jgi:hypothetical protein
MGTTGVRVEHYIYNSETGDDHVQTVLALLAEREESIEYHDVAAADDRRDGLREAMLTLRNAVRIGTNPDEIYDPEGIPDFSVGVLVTEEQTGRRRLHIGTEAVTVLRDDGSE